MVIRNAAMLLSGTSGATIIGLLSWTLTARALGVEQLGILVMIQAYVLTIDAFVNFQSEQATIRFAAEAIERRRDDELADVLKFGLIIDLCSALAGAMLGLAGAYWFAHWQGWDQQFVVMTALLSLTIAVNIKGTPTALLRLFDRFDLLAWHQTVAAALRLTLILGVYLYHPTLWGFFLAWMIGEVAGYLLLLAFGWHEMRRSGMRIWTDGRARQATLRHEGIWRFLWTTNINNSVKFGGRQIDVLLLGILFSPAAAGLLKIIKLFVKGLRAVAIPLDHAIYPGLARLWSSGRIKKFKTHLAWAGAIGGTVGLSVWFTLLLTGPWILENVFGSDYREAYIPLMVYLAPAALELFAIGFRSALLSMGKVTVILVSTLAGYGVYFVVLPILAVPFGLLGAAFAQFVHHGISAVVTGYVTIQTIRAFNAAPLPINGESA